MRTYPLVIAHRGVHGPGLPENTMAAFEAALAAGADMIELDVRRTAAGELIVIHDHRHRGVLVAEVSRDELERSTGLRPPLLAEVLDWARERIALDVELKEDGYVEEVAASLSAFRGGGGRLLVTSFIESALTALGESAPELIRGLLLTWTAEQAVDRAQECGARVLLPDVKLAREPLLSDAIDAGLEVVVWDFMASRDPGLLDDQRLAGVITDNVPGALAFRSARPEGTGGTLNL